MNSCINAQSAMTNSLGTWTENVAMDALAYQIDRVKLREFRNDN